MAAWLLLLLLSVCLVLIGTQGSLLEFGHMILLVTRRAPIRSYAFYGCHCGFGGQGPPTDEIDWCCHVHDCCFGRTANMGCNPKWKRYDFHFVNGTVTCNSTENSECAQQACECDREAALCFKQHNDKYGWQYRVYGRHKCVGTAPEC
ncbi:basic phospholipase A2 homolog Vur-S49 [Xenopus tropicalis]|uniref:Phospholipase A2 n=2 Tax=Xenopus tropicalis TaxID=8364 RepID=A0A803K1C6_XENTR|nr:basic phospholipase A2 homolog Vur-S49 [Xenopus tropicalis]